MINLKLATILTTIAEISKFDSATDKSILNLSKAARTIRDFEGDVSELYDKGTLKSLPGIDDYAFNLIEEYFTKGHIKILEDTKKKYSEELLKIVRISGIGTKNAFSVYEALQVKDLEELKKLLSDKNKIEAISCRKNISLNFLNRVACAINYFEDTNQRSPRWYALNISKRVIGLLRTFNNIESIEFVGSFRRKKPIINDLDILVLPNFNKDFLDLSRSVSLLEKISRLPFIKGVVSKDIRKENVSYLFNTTFEIDLEIIITSKLMWASDLILSTGNKKHIKQLIEIAGSKNLLKDGKVIFDTSVNYSNEKMTLDSEEVYRQEVHFYQKMGMQYIPPELREGKNEIELAMGNRLPGLIRLSDIKGDLHVHSSWSDGIISLRKLIEKVKEKGYEYIALTDHSVSNIYGNGLSEEKVLRKFKYIDALRCKDDYPSFLMGSEVEIRKSIESEYHENILKNLDIVIASMHTGFSNTKKDNTQKIQDAIKNKYVDMIAHPTGSVFGSRAPYFLDLDQIIMTASKYKKALEINSYFLRLDLNEENAKKAKDAGVLIAINSDTHRLNNLDMISLGVDIARRAGLEKEDVLNTKCLADLLKWKKERS